MEVGIKNEIKMEKGGKTKNSKAGQEKKERLDRAARNQRKKIRKLKKVIGRNQKRNRTN